MPQSSNPHGFRCPHCQSTEVSADWSVMVRGDIDADGDAVGPYEILDNSDGEVTFWCHAEDREIGAGPLLAPAADQAPDVEQVAGQLPFNAACVLTNLTDPRGMSANEIAPLAGLAPGTVLGHLDSLTSLGLVAPAGGPDVATAALWSLTDTGRDAADHIMSRHPDRLGR